MNNIISVYELLGLIKDEKAPKKIKYNNRTYEFKEIEEGTGYVYESGIVKIWLSNEIELDISRCLNDKVEILEEDKPIIEKIEIEEDIVCNKFVKNEYGLNRHRCLVTNNLIYSLDNREKDCPLIITGEIKD